MTSASGHWDDLLPRLLSALALAGIALFAVWLGGTFFNVFVAAIIAVMVWELARMLEAGAALWIALAACVAVIAAAELQSPLLLLLMLPTVLAIPVSTRMRVSVAAALLGILVASYGITRLRADHGMIWMIWFALVVAASDIGGYFAGRTIGGPKFWPKVSPKKTWSGTVAGWIAAALVSIPFVAMGETGWILLIIAAAMALAGQMGDIAESALKRQAGVKDASGLMPGHGGLLDRFDSMVGASLFLLFLIRLTAFP